MQNNIPILLIVFNRPELTERLLGRLKKCKVQHLFVAIDGPRINNVSDAQNCVQVLSQVKSIDWVDHLSILQQPSNLGCGKAVSSAINWFFAHNEKGIILEDDCLPSQTFFSFCEKALLEFHDNEKIWHIDGSNFNPHSSNILFEYSKFPLIWGWATWKNRWEKYQYQFNPESAKKIIANQFIDYFQRKYWENRLNDFFINKVDTWDYQWMLTIWKHGGIVVRPPVNCIKNTGFGENGTHTISNSLSYLSLPEKDFDLSDYRLAKNDVIDKKNDNQQFIHRFMRGSVVFKYLFFINDNFFKK